jgi:hypothetical protein
MMHMRPSHHHTGPPPMAYMRGTKRRYRT